MKKTKSEEKAKQESLPKNLGFIKKSKSQHVSAQMSFDNKIIESLRANLKTQFQSRFKFAKQKSKEAPKKEKYEEFFQLSKSINQYISDEGPHQNPR